MKISVAQIECIYLLVTLKYEKSLNVSTIEFLTLTESAYQGDIIHNLKHSMYVQNPRNIFPKKNMKRSVYAVPAISCSPNIKVQFFSDTIVRT